MSSNEDRSNRCRAPCLHLRVYRGLGVSTGPLFVTSNLYRVFMLRRCSRCKLEKPISEYTSYPSKTDCYCRPCRAEYGREHYLKNRARYVENAMRRTQRMVRSNMSLLVDFLRRHPCVDCGETDPLVLEFDHQKDKCFEIARGVREKSWAHVLREIEKCEVVCANCHRRRTARTWGFTKALFISTEKQLPLF